VEAIHTATLLHDDVIDKAETRRSGPSANQVFDNTIPVLSGDYLMSDAIHQLAIRGIPSLMQGMCIALKELSQGEILQYQNQFKIADSEKFYHLVCELKTASLLKWAASVGPQLRCKDEVMPVASFARNYGLLYQLTDDILDLRGTHTKAKNQDLREGKVNWAAWRVLQNEPKLKNLLLQDFSKQKLSSETEQQFLEAFNQSYNQSSLTEFLESTKNECLDSIQNLKSNNLRQLLRTLIDFTAARVF
jgi:geranylgeranyl pyrophosphate synthase